MTLVDRFICRREGHIPTTTLTKISGFTITSYITTCKRCGKTYEFVVTPQTDKAAS